MEKKPDLDALDRQMARDDDGGPAFPRQSDGMSLRDYFAAQLLSGIYSGGDTDWDDQIMARRAYELADAMLKARKK